MFRSKFAVILNLLRAKQWVKNFLLIVPFFATGLQLNLTNLRLLFLGFSSFCIVASIIYIINDWHDQEFDRLHETKSKRPIASGEASAKFVGVSVMSLVLLLFILLTQLNESFIMVVIIYVFNSLLYTFYLKKIVVVELVSVSMGFILRAYAGAMIFNIELSSWFILVTWFSSLYLVLGKREAEWRKYNQDSKTRSVFKDYSNTFLKDSKLVSFAVALISYCLWALIQKADNLYSTLSILPATVFFLSYSNQLEKSQSESPETIMLGSRIILLCLGAILILLYLSTY